jgi:hypothetical protein
MKLACLGLQAFFLAPSKKGDVAAVLVGRFKDGEIIFGMKGQKVVIAEYDSRTEKKNRSCRPLPPSRTVQNDGSNDHLL